tara:strand:- start:56 stop:565 length:510 start_codon:yes stop_codon:yes gene_type:complete
MARTVEIILPATSFIPTSVNGAQFVAHVHNNTPRPALAFDAGADEFAVSVPLVMPASYAAGDVKVDIFFYSASANSGTAAWSVTLEAITASTDTLDLEASSSLPAGTVGTHSMGGTAGDLRKLAVTLSATSMDSVAAGDQMRLAFFRDVSGDDVAGDLYVPFVVLYEGT